MRLEETEPKWARHGGSDRLVEVLLRIDHDDVVQLGQARRQFRQHRMLCVIGDEPDGDRR
jgi:hypothetical protein